MPAGRPTDYTEELADEICRKVALGSNLRRISQEESMPCEETLYRWRKEIPEFSKKYQDAVEERADARNHNIDDLKDKVETGVLEPNAANVILKAEIWQAGRENPKRYGDKTEITGKDGKDLIPQAMPDSELARRIASILSQVDKT